MAFVVGIYTSDPNLLRCELARLRTDLVLGDERKEALGVGWYAEQNILLQRYAPKVRPGSLEQIGGVLESDALVAHGGALAVGMSLEENLQPFRYRSWMFANHGEVTQVDRFRNLAMDALPDHLGRSIKGSTAHEVAFALFLAALRDLGRTDDDELEARAAAKAIGEAARRLDALAQRAGARDAALGMISTNGHVMVAARLGNQPVYYRLLEGSATCEVCGLNGDGSALAQAQVRSHLRRKSVVISTNVKDAHGWIPLESGTALGVGATLDVETVRF